MSSRTATVRTSQTSTQSKQDNATSSQQETKPQDRCAHCKKFLPAVKAECKYCRQIYCMEHRHPETHSPDGCAQKAKDQSRQEYRRESGHILGAESHDRGSTHRPGWNVEASRQELAQRLSQRVQTLKESSGRTNSGGDSSSSGGGGSGSRGGGVPKKGKKKPAKKPPTWGSGGQKLGGVPGSGSTD